MKEILARGSSIGSAGVEEITRMSRRKFGERDSGLQSTDPDIEPGTTGELEEGEIEESQDVATGTQVHGGETASGGETELLRHWRGTHKE